MGLLSKLKAVLGLGSDEDDRVGRQSTDVGVTVERERDEADAGNEAAVKGVETTESDDETAESDATTEPAARAESEPDASTEPSASADSELDESAATESETDESDATTDTDADEPETTTDAETDESAASDGEEVQDIKGIGPAYADRLAEVGIETVGELAAADQDVVAEEADLAPGRVEQWVDRAKARQ